MVHYEKVHGRLSRFVKSMVWDREEARDIVSETVVIAFERFDKVADKEKFLFFLFGIASRLIKQHLKKKSRYQVLSDEEWSELEFDADSLPREEISDLYRLLGSMPYMYREALVLFEISGFSIKEASEMLEISVSGVKSRLTRARDFLEMESTHEVKKVS